MNRYGNPPEETRFKPGQSGNPKGRPKGSRTFKSIIREVADTEVLYKNLNNIKHTMSAGEALIVSLFGKAIYKQDVQAAKTLMETLEGKPAQDVNQNNTGTPQVVINKNYYAKEDADI